ncbi:hypothetical protein V1517DRAFT_316761 [Lipomyces orientalis]|uniref:Uncharacterized protein n=1 Tax=Lipomyces orientalis TaxID=1233043 RepID=A0ACC3TTI2_9ASCO
MKMNTMQLLEGLVLILALPLSTSAFGADKKGLLSNVQTLTLRKGAMTTGRRQKIPQLQVVGGDAKDLYEVEVMQCRNMGSGDGGSEDVQWKCSADIPGYFKLGTTEVQCEGYSSANDRYILRGSCGVKYTIHLTDAGYARYGKRSYLKSNSRSDDYSSLSTLLMFLGLVALAYYLAWYFSNRRHNNIPSGRRGPTRSIFGNLFNNGDDNGGDGGPPPPPYSRHDNNNGSGKWFSTTQSDQRREWQQHQQERQWRPGFWSGLGAGAAATALYNRFANSGPTPAERANMYRDAMFYDDDFLARQNRPLFGGRSSWGGARSSSGGREDSARTSTGFGGTSRR